MRFPSFVRLPNHRQFNYTPRYYDPIKEEIEQRTKLLKSEKNVADRDGRTIRISTAFGNRQRENRKTGVTQIVLMVFFAALTAVYIFLGPTGIYWFGGISATVIIIRRAIKSSRKNGR